MYMGEINTSTKLQIASHKVHQWVPKHQHATAGMCRDEYYCKAVA